MKIIIYDSIKLHYITWTFLSIKLGIKKVITWGRVGTSTIFIAKSSLFLAISSNAVKAYNFKLCCCSFKHRTIWGNTPENTKHVCYSSVYKYVPV